MSTTSIGGVSGQNSQQASGGVDAWGKVDLSQFVKLLIAELSNQDPLEPMKNQEILQQMSQIREIESNTKLSDTLDSVLLGQNVATAGNMLNKVVEGLTDDGQRIAGQVDRITITDGAAKLHIGEQTISLKNVAQIMPEGSTVPTEADEPAAADTQ
jgi:flagellar basal-body rod modification protein FlgD